MTTGTLRSGSICAVFALKALQNSMMLTPCWPSAGPMGGAGVAWPALICSLMTAETFFLGGMSGPNDWMAGGSSHPLGDGQDGEGSDLGDLVERQLDGRLATEDGHEHLELLRVGVDLGDRRREGLERTLHDGDGLADLEVHDLDLGLRGALAALDRRQGRREHREALVEAQRHGLVGVAHEAGDARRVPDGA